MRTKDLFKIDRSARRINESIEKVFGKKINLENFSLDQLEDTRNKLRTQLHHQRSTSGFNENIENDAYTKAQWMLDAINSEIAQREEFIVDSVQESADIDENALHQVLVWWDRYMDEVRAYGSPDFNKVMDLLRAGDIDEAVAEIAYSYTDQDGGEIPRMESYMDDLQDKLEDALGMSGAEESIEEKAPPGAKAERMVKHIKAGYAKDGKLTDKEKSIAYATAWKQHNKEKNESIETGEDMTKLTEGEIQQASAIVTAKTMVDRVGRWIEELSGMENDTLLQLGDSIRDEMGQEQAKQFISVCAPAIQQALESLKATRETLASGVRTLTGEEQAAGMLGAAPDETGMDAAAPDAMNPEPDMGDELALEPEADEFAASDAAVGGVETAGRAKRESIDYGNRLLKVLAG